MESVRTLRAEVTDQAIVREAPRERLWQESRILQAVAAPFVASRAILLAVTMGLAMADRASPVAVLDRWDTRWFEGIAIHGYSLEAAGKPALAFFPLLPAIMHLADTVRLSPVLAAFAVSNLSFAGALIYLYLLTEQRSGSAAARRSIWLLALMPTAFFTFVPYSEGPFLLCATGALYHSGRRQPFAAGLFLAVSLLTRSTGVILVPPVLMLALANRGIGSVREERAKALSYGRRIFGSLAMALGPSVVAIAGYAWYLSSRGISPWSVISAQRSWHRGLSWPWQGFVSSVGWLTRHGLRDPDASPNILGIVVVLICLALTVLAWRSLSPAAAAYCACYWVLVLCTTAWHDGYYWPFISVDRFIVVLFPLAAWAASRLQGRRYQVFLVLSAAAMVGAAGVHLSGGWVG
jgi:hypothetical protein